MTTLATRDLERLQSAMLELHEPRSLDELRNVAPGIFLRVVPADYFAWLESGVSALGDFDGDGVLWEHPPGRSGELLRRAMALVDEHPFTRHVLETGDMGPMRLSDFWTRRQLLGSRYYEQVYGPLGVGRLMSIAVPRGSRAGSISLARPLDARDFSERDRELLRLLAPHFLLAVSAAERASARRAAESEALAQLGLTARERAVATWLARGRSNPEIADALAMRPRTVEKHVERILPKLGVENRTAAANLILGLGSGRAPEVPAADAQPREALRRVLRPVGPRRAR